MSTIYINPHRFGGGGTSTLLTDLVAWWALEESSGTRVDSHDDHDGTPISSPGNGTGKQGNCLDIEGSSTQYLIVSDHADFVQGGTNPVSINMWYKPESITGGQGLFAQAAEIVIRVYPDDTDQVEFILNSFSTNDRVQTTSSPLSVGTWVMLTFIYDGADLKIHINGSASADASVTPTGTWSNSSTDIRIGNFSSSSSADGLMDEVAYWNKGLTTSEIAELYAGGDGITYSDISSQT